jgi:cAMP phosphodiesterase
LADTTVGIRTAKARGKAKSTGFIRTTPFIKRAEDNSTTIVGLNVKILLLRKRFYNEKVMP